VRLLLDTAPLLWWLADDRLLGNDARAAIALPENLCAVSVASVFEAESERAAGRLTLPDDWLDALEPDFLILPIGIEHAALAAALPAGPADDVDRFLVAQAQLDGYAIVTADPVFAAFHVPTLPA
jgi:PIN domain nuclease of toxin-antitoxin system